MTGASGAAGLAALLLLAACAAGGDEGNEAAPAPAETTVDSATTPAEPAAADEASATPNLAFDAEGLRLVSGPGGAARPLPFGMAQQQLLSVLEAFRGPADRGSNDECGAGPIDYAVWADGLTLNFQEGRFVGWALDRRAEGAHATMSGTGPGSTRRELESAYDIEVEQTTLGTEFSAGGLSGLLDGQTPAARITDLWAGAICAFR